MVKNTKDCLQFFLIITIIIIIITTIKKNILRQSLLFGKIFASLSSIPIGQKPDEILPPSPADIRRGDFWFSGPDCQQKKSRLITEWEQRRLIINERIWRNGDILRIESLI